VATNLQLYTGVTIKAKANNDNDVWIGNVNLQKGTKNGYLLEPGESVFLEVNNLNSVWIKADGDGGNTILYIGS